MTPAAQYYLIAEDEMEDIHAMIHILFEQRAVEILQKVTARPYTSASSDVLELITARIAELQKELPGKTAKDMCVTLALIGENQAMWAQIKELRQQTKERERG